MFGVNKPSIPQPRQPFVLNCNRFPVSQARNKGLCVGDFALLRSLDLNVQWLQDQGRADIGLEQMIWIL